MDREFDIIFMRRALELSKKGLGATSPNPIVGCVVVRDGKIIGEGYHKTFGGDHAEVVALKRCKESAEGSTIYVTLEPCSHFGKTPPCTDALIKANVKRVVVAMQDPNKIVSGRGIEALKNAGIDVDIGLCGDEASALNEIYIKYISTKTPFVLLKSAMTLDGKTATKSGDSKWITGEKSREYVHKLRHVYSAIMVGAGTVIADDPLLNTRLEGGKDPIKIVVDEKLNIPLSARLFKGNAKTILVTTHDCDKKKAAAFEKIGAEILRLATCEGGHISFIDIMSHLGEIGIDSVMIEGGGTLNSRALTDGVVDKMITFVAPKLVGGRDAKTLFEGIGFDKISQSIEVCHAYFEKIGEDIMITSYFDRGGENVYRYN